MKRMLAALLLCFLIVGMVSAQEEQSGYEIALELIHSAEANHWTDLDLSDIGLSELPPELWELSDLRELYLGNSPFTHVDDLNHLTVLPPEIARLEQLEVLDISSNLLTNLPPEIGSLEHLEILWLPYNQLSSLPPEIAQLKSLCILNLMGNNLRELPSEMGQMTALYEEIACRSWRSGIILSENPQLSIPAEVIIEGTPAVLAYLRNEAWFYMQKLIVSGLAILGVVTLSVLGLRWRNRRGKQKRKHA
jgi:hypothetical protein